eukprot:362059-Amphidinium_carterae.1
MVADMDNRTPGMVTGTSTFANIKWEDVIQMAALSAPLHQAIGSGKRESITLGLTLGLAASMGALIPEFKAAPALADAAMIKE